MPIKIERNTYTAPAIQKPLHDDAQDYSGMATIIAKLGEVALKSKEAVDNGESESKLSEYQTECAIKLKELELSNVDNIQDAFNKEAASIKDRILKGANDNVVKTFNDNVYKINNRFKLSVVDAQLKLDSIKQRDYMDKTISNNLISIKADPKNSYTYIQDILGTINSPHSQLNAEQRDTFSKQAFAQASVYRALSEYESTGDINKVVKDIDSGKYNVSIVQGDKEKEFSLNGQEKLKLLQTIVQEDWNNQILNNPQSLKIQVDNKQYPFKVKGVGELFDPSDKTKMLLSLDKAVQEKEISIKDVMEREKNNVYLRALNGDTVAIEQARELASKGNEKDKEIWNYIVRQNPAECATKDEALSGLLDYLTELKGVDIDRKASADNPESGASQYMRLALDTQRYIKERNLKFNDLSSADSLKWQRAVNEFGNLNLENKEVFVDNIKALEDVTGTFFKTDIMYKRAEKRLPFKDFKGKRSFLGIEYDQNRTKLSKAQVNSINGLIRMHINNTLDIINDPSINTQEKKQLALKEEMSYFDNGIRLAGYPELYDPLTQTIKKEGSIVNINGMQLVFKGFQSDNKYEPVLEVVRGK